MSSAPGTPPPDSSPPDSPPPDPPPPDSPPPAAPWAAVPGAADVRRATSRLRRTVEGLPDWEPLPPGETLVRRGRGGA
ncbi:hypothetical protein RB200_42235 [Streptomyces sp. PmtG]